VDNRQIHLDSICCWVVCSCLRHANLGSTDCSESVRRVCSPLAEAMKIVTENWAPGEWQAYDDNTFDGPGSIVGSGKTEAEAITDLNEQHEDEWERPRKLLCGETKCS